MIFRKSIRNALLSVVYLKYQIIRLDEEMAIDTLIDLQQFYPSDVLKIISVNNSDEGIRIKLKSQTHSCICNKCGNTATYYHGTYTRRVQDLPILGRNVLLEITAYEYKCENPLCDVKSIAENFDGFLNSYSRMTERCADFICTLALETSCEGAARICKCMNLKTSGDSIIRILLKRYESQEALECGSTIGIDDFAFKKRSSYGTVIVDENTHQPIAVLDGRDGESLRKWLKNNKHVKAVTRDRASAYAKVISEELPAAMQIADRFHLHQNLLEAVHKSIGREIPVTIPVPKNQSQDDCCSPDRESECDNTLVETSKKNATNCG